MHSWRNTSFSINLYFCSKFLCQNVDRNINIKCKTFHEDAGEPRQVQGWLGCLWKGLDLKVATWWTDPTLPLPHITNTHNAKSLLYTKLCPEEPEETKAGTKVIGVPMQKSWLSGSPHRWADPLHPTSHSHNPTPTQRKINILCQTCFKESGET